MHGFLVAIALFWARGGWRVVETSSWKGLDGAFVIISHLVKKHPDSALPMSCLFTDF